MVENRQISISKPTLPRYARLPVNRCSLPAIILGSLTFQMHPVALHLDGVLALHSELFNDFVVIDNNKERAENFRDYMCSSFLLDDLEAAGLEKNGRRWRGKADYLRMLRGWLFDANSTEAAVLKSWVESRFGLLARNHNGSLSDFSSNNYLRYLSERSQGLYNTNALEAQFDLLFSYCQYEVQRQFSGQTHIVLYRGTNRIDDYEILKQLDKHRFILLLNNLNSFTSQRERADEFGDYILEVKIPLSKILYLPGLLPGILKGENEFLVIGGVYEVALNVL